MNIQAINDDIRFTRYRMSSRNLPGVLREALAARIESLERQLSLLKDAGLLPVDSPLGCALRFDASRT